MLEKERSCSFVLLKKILFFFNIFFILFFTSYAFASDLQKDLINKLTATSTLTFNFIQKISDKEEIGNCFIKYPLLMKCNYKNLKQKILISNGKKVVIIKKKYKKIYSYPIEVTPLFFILKKEKIINLIRKTQPTYINSNLIEFKFIDKKENIIKIFFDKNSLNFKGWETTDAYSNYVSFKINNLITNNQIMNSFFKIPKEEDL